MLLICWNVGGSLVEFWAFHKDSNVRHAWSPAITFYGGYLKKDSIDSDRERKTINSHISIALSLSQNVSADFFRLC